MLFFWKSKQDRRIEELGQALVALQKRVDELEAICGNSVYSNRAYRIDKIINAILNHLNVALEYKKYTPSSCVVKPMPTKEPEQTQTPHHSV